MAKTKGTRPKPDPKNCFVAHGMIQVIEIPEKQARAYKCMGCTLKKTFSLRWFAKRGITDARRVNQEIEKRMNALTQAYRS